MRKTVGVLLFFSILIAIAGSSVYYSDAIQTWLLQKQTEWVTYYGDDGDTVKTELNGIRIVLDAGHGGVDPGKVGASGSLEKDINLAIVKKLQRLLEESGYVVILTRNTDEGLYSEDDSNKKRADLRERVNLIETSGADFVISIHQNSYPSADVKGAQTFYYQSSEESKRLAELLQEAIAAEAADGNHRKAKANSNYYLLTRTTCPIVIVECGFLSNAAEEALLGTEGYQDLMAWAIFQGIEKYTAEGK